MSLLERVLPPSANVFRELKHVQYSILSRRVQLFYQMLLKFNVLLHMLSLNTIFFLPSSVFQNGLVLVRIKPGCSKLMFQNTRSSERPHLVSTRVRLSGCQVTSEIFPSLSSLRNKGVVQVVHSILTPDYHVFQSR